MAMFHVIVQNTSKELVANKVSKTDSLRPSNNVNITLHIFQDFHSKVKLIFLFTKTCAYLVEQIFAKMVVHAKSQKMEKCRVFAQRNLPEYIAKMVTLFK